MRVVEGIFGALKWIPRILEYVRRVGKGSFGDVCRLQVSRYEAALALHKALYRYICSAFSGEGDIYSPLPPMLL